MLNYKQKLTISWVVVGLVVIFGVYEVWLRFLDPSPFSVSSLSTLGLKSEDIKDVVQDKDMRPIAIKCLKQLSAGQDKDVSEREYAGYRFGGCIAAEEAKILAALPPSYVTGTYFTEDCDAPLFENYGFRFNLSAIEGSNQVIPSTMKKWELGVNFGSRLMDDKKFSIILPQHDKEHCAHGEVKARVQIKDIGLNIKEGPSSATLLNLKLLSQPVYKIKLGKPMDN